VLEGRMGHYMSEATVLREPVFAWKVLRLTPVGANQEDLTHIHTNHVSLRKTQQCYVQLTSKDDTGTRGVSVISLSS
jgi:hypothetical protein